MSYDSIKEEIFNAITIKEYMNAQSEKRIAKILNRLLVVPGNHELEEIHEIIKQLPDPISEGVKERINTAAYIISMIKDE